MISTIASPVENLLSRLEGVRRCTSGWSAKCPAHEDRLASLSISTGDDGRALVRCHAGCSAQQIVLKLGMQMRDLFAPSEKYNGNHNGNGNGNRRKLGPILKTYDYRNAEGELVHQTTRHAPKDFSQRRPDGKGGWIWSLRDIQPILYRIPDLLAAFEDRPDDWVLITEGEKDVDRAWENGFIATCNAMGAGKWREGYSETLRGRRCCIVSDRDEPGRMHARKVAASLTGKAREVRVIECPGDGVKDLSDWFDAGGTKEALLELVNTAPTWVPAEVPAEDQQSLQPRAERASDDRATELANAEQLHRLYGHKLLYHNDRGEFFVWVGTH